MSKFTKFIFNPKKFIKESWLFRYGFPHTFKSIDNLFVISHLGQLGQVEALINKERFVRSYLLILYTKKNLKVPKAILNKVNKSLFTRVNLLELPVKPNEINIKKLTYLDNSYEKLIREIKPKNLFVLSFEKHYCLLISRCIERKVKINLIEEGTATYKYSSSREAIDTLKNNLTPKEKKVALLINILPFFKKLRPALTIPKELDNTYSCFPKRLENIFSIKKSKYFFIHEGGGIINEKIINLNNKYNITENDMVFLNQRYPIPVAIYANKLLFILSLFAEKLQGRVFIKLHPKDTIELKEALRESIHNMGYAESVFLIDESEFLVEPLIYLARPKLVLALTSTTLVYTKLLSEYSNPISIYPILKGKLLEDMSYSDKYFAEVENHFSILKKFDIALINEDMDIAEA
ncbi:Alpha-2,8-polysialyltransferase (POLYST) [Pasteurella testudinis DSM 23072]|uniref:Alpha-2,8-polysialyltransferase (POLYST) n=1 Tax=Pasteurella testudinis DSM 23072 TaxID=1122938 RepID=A0A1W1V8Q8_9PAST|nr:alpha-2,8-polysialyltransferase family protein [Pasteurella testudinis]SMB89857.1 Alpha-2,8-polysialyltransferase (POLYST) [Pasteurella testudinis DSM 23072]SUB52105.1 Alpha-2,8-polysialyltransferase (POLYST) [Pasteurella testudinis]